MPKKKGARARLSPTDKEVIYQTYVACGKKNETAKRLGVSLGSVQNVIKELEGRNPAKPQLPTTKAARAEAAASLASRIHVEANEVLDSITPQDLESGRIALHEDREDPTKVTGYKYYGPSLLQKATTFGIIVDKANVAQQYERKMLEDTHSGQLMLPDTIEGMVAAVRGSIKQMRFLDIRFEEDNPDLITNAEEVIAKVETVERARPDVVSIDEFDNP